MAHYLSPCWALCWGVHTGTEFSSHLLWVRNYNFLIRPLRRGRIEVTLPQSPTIFSNSQFLILHTEAKKPLAKPSLFLVFIVFKGVGSANLSTKKILSSQDKQSLIGLLADPLVPLVTAE